jgi:polysaccharide export outer membrane protein
MKRSLFFLAIIFLGSCVSHKSLVYLQDKNGIGAVVPINPIDYEIKTGDLLHVRVQALDQDVEKIFNTREFGLSSASANSRSNFYIHGYNVNSEGRVTLPIIGEVSVVGKTTEDARIIIQEKLDKFFVDATATVKLLNHNFTVLGEVSRPGTYDMFNDRFSILDALGMAGDMTDYGNRKVTIWRRGESDLTSYTIDLTSREVISSEWFLLQPGDLVYVEPFKQKRTGFGTFPFGVVFQSITTAVTLFYFFKALSN